MTAEASAACCRPAAARSVRRAGAALLAAACAAVATACISPSDPLGRVEALTEVQRRYTEAIRWGDLERAARFVDPELRPEFLALGDAFKTIRISDFEIGEVELSDDDHLRAEVEVVYLGFALPHYVERRVSDRQTWVRHEGLGNRWHVRPELASLIGGLGATVPQ